MFYPYSNPVVMTDDIFQKFGGTLGETLPEVRDVSYVIAEQLVSEDIGTYLTPTTVTGTYGYSPRIILDHAYVSSIRFIRFYDEEERLYWTVTGTANVYATLEGNGDYGKLDLHQVMANYVGCWTSQWRLPEKIQVVYDTGLSSGTANQPQVLLALTLMSKIVLNEIIGFGNEAPGDIGVQSFSNQNYSERRVGLIRTIYGSSAQAQFIHKLLGGLRLRRYVGLGQA